MVHVWWCYTKFSACSSAILERRVSGTMDRTRQTFPWFKSLRFLSLEHLKSTVYAAEVNDVHHMQQRILNALQIIHTTIGIFHRIRQSLTLQPCNSRLEVQGRHWAFSLIVRRSNSETMLPKSCVHKTLLLLLWCRLTFCRFDRAFFIHPVYGWKENCYKFDSICNSNYWPQTLITDSWRKSDFSGRRGMKCHNLHTAAFIIFAVHHVFPLVLI